MGMNPNVAQAVISGVGQLGQGIIGSIMQKRENQRQREYETQAYERSKQDNLDFWNMSNMYNSPEQQMARLKQAKLNPNLVYGQGANATVDTLKAPSPNTSNSTNTVNPLGSLDIGGNIAQLYDLKVKDAQANLLNQQAETQKTQQSLNALESELKRLDAIRLRTSNKYDIQSLDKRIDILQAQYDKYLVDMANTRSQTRKTDTERQISIEQNNRQRQIQPYTISQLKENIRNTQAGTKEKLANISYTRSNTKLTNEKIKTERILQALNEWEQKLNKSGTTKNDGLIKRTIAQVWKKMIGGDLDEAYQLIENNK